MANTKRPRACDACHSIKIKCELGSSGGSGPCKRCIRLGKECTVTFPKRQKDRVAELEAQVAALTKLLESQSLASQIADPASQAAESAPMPCASPTTVLSQKKRKLAAEADPPDDSIHEHIERFDRIVSIDTQRELVEKYARIAVPMVPVVPLPDNWTIAHFRDTRPILTLTIAYSMSTGTLSEQDQDKLGSIILDLLERPPTDGKRSLELVQAMQVAALWYRAPRNHRQITSFQLAQRAADIAKRLGWGDQSRPSLDNAATTGETDPTSSLRAWLTCHVLSTSIMILMRKPSLKNLPELDPFSTHMLEYLDSSQKTNRVLCHLVRAESLCDTIVSKLKLLDFETCEDVSDLEMQVKMQTSQNSIVDWSTQIPMDPPCLTLGLYEYLTTLYLHETVLHTSTNKQSFAGPFLAERLSITDFPAPMIVTEQHLNSLNALRIASHAIIDLFATFSIETWVSSPFVLSIGRVAYAEYILMKLYIATTAIGNTFGAFVDPSSLRVEKYLDMVIAISKAAQEVDTSCPAARLLLAPTRLKEWLATYNATHGLASTSSDYGSKEASPAVADEIQFDWYDTTLDNKTPDWDLDNFVIDPSALHLVPDP